MTHAMHCTAFDERLADYLEGDLGPAERQAVQAHMASCVRCTALVRDLERIRIDAGELGELSPSRDLWAGIADRIETPVVPLAARVAPNAVVRPRGMERLRLAAVAAALVVVTAGVTYVLTVRGGVSQTSAVASNSIPERPADSAAPSVTSLDAPVQQAVGNPDRPAAQGDDPSGASTPATSNVGNPTAASSTSREIDRLRTVFARTRGQLDPRTAAIIEANLKVIDDAIAQSRAALEQDPASRFLNNQLNSALDKKLELLRTAAMLPNRT